LRPTLILVVTVALAASGCTNTVNGLGQDMQNAGSSLSNWAGSSPPSPYDATRTTTGPDTKNQAYTARNYANPDLSGPTQRYNQPNVDDLDHQHNNTQPYDLYHQQP
jgi:predicted small secreted protein